MGLNLRVKTKAKVDESVRNKEDEELEPLSPQSQAFFSEKLSLQVLAVFESETSIDVTALYDWLKNDFIPTSTRFSSIMIEDNEGKQMWKRVQVNVKDHVIIPHFPSNLSPENYRQHFDDYMSKIAKEQVSRDREKPLWECHVIKYPTSHTIHGIFIFKLHHAIADGVSLMGSLFSCFRRADDKSLPLTFPSSKSKDQKQNGGNNFTKILSLVAKFLSSFLSSFYHVQQGVARILFEDDCTPIRSGHTDVSNSFGIGTTIFSLNDVKRIKTSLGVTVNDVVLGTIFLGIKLYMQKMNPELRKVRTTAIVSVNTRSTKGYVHANEMQKDKTKVPWGNKFTVAHLPIQNLGQEALGNPLNFVMNAHKMMKGKTTSFGQFILTSITDAIYKYGGPKVASRIQYRVVKNASLEISNMIGPIEQMSLANHPITGFYFMVAGMKLSLVVSVMSYMQHLRIGLGVERDFINQPMLMKCVENAFELILQATTTTCVSS